MLRPTASTPSGNDASLKRSGLMSLAGTAALLVAVLTLAGCSATASSKQALGSDVDDLDGTSLALAADRTAEVLGGAAAARTYTVAGLSWTGAELAESAQRVADVARKEKSGRKLTKRLARECEAFPVSEPAKVTAYYEPLLSARATADSRFRYPLYRLPSAAQLAALERRLGRVPTRADIDGGMALSALGLELAWVDDPVARFFLHVQGSGRLVFEDGTETRVGYAGTNQLGYQSVGAVMLREGLLERGKASATAMRTWLAEHPDRRDGLLFQNPRYIFFRDTGSEGPIGALGTTLVAGRSIATDERFVPRGLLVWLRTTKPVVGEDGALLGQRPLTRFVFAQDAGAAIKGVARVDVFWGSGEQAGVEAGGMNQSGELYLLLCGKAAKRAAKAR